MSWLFGSLTVWMLSFALAPNNAYAGFANEAFTSRRFDVGAASRSRATSPSFLSPHRPFVVDDRRGRGRGRCSSWTTSLRDAEDDVVETPRRGESYGDEPWPEAERRVGWDDLPSELRNAAETLGYDRRTWDESDPYSDDDRDDYAALPCAGKRWADLTTAEQDAATVLGFSEPFWNAGWGTQVSWDELSSDIRDAAETLGFDRRTWESGGDIPCENKEWTELDDAEQRAATVLGFTETDWNAA